MTNNGRTTRMPPRQVLRHYESFTCVICGATFWVRKKIKFRYKTCSHACSAQHRKNLCRANSRRFRAKHPDYYRKYMARKRAAQAQEWKKKWGAIDQEAGT